MTRKKVFFWSYQIIGLQCQKHDIEEKGKFSLLKKICALYVTVRNAIALYVRNYVCTYITLRKCLSFSRFLYNSLIQNQNKNSSIVTAAKWYFMLKKKRNNNAKNRAN